jgi:Fur family peroxide stress response transcriptional regulator
MTYRMTPQRMAILGILEGNRDHPSAEDVHREVKKSYPTMSLATVYNTLKLLCERGELLELAIDPARKRYDPEMADHSHIMCEECGGIADVGRSVAVRLGEDERMGYEITGTCVQFYGRCPECRDKEVKGVAEFKCEKCGATKEGRCKPKKCPACGESGCMQKQE